jgi:hypothetical protein
VEPHACHCTALRLKQLSLCGWWALRSSGMGY